MVKQRPARSLKLLACPSITQTSELNILWRITQHLSERLFKLSESAYKDGELNREYLAKEVFGSKEKLSGLNVWCTQL